MGHVIVIKPEITYLCVVSCSRRDELALGERERGNDLDKDTIRNTEYPVCGWQWVGHGMWHIAQVCVERVRSQCMRQQACLE